MGTAYIRALESNLTLTQTSGVNVNMLESASNMLTLIQEADSQYKIKTVLNQIALDHNALTNILLTIDLNNTLSLTQTVVKKGTLYVDASNQLDFTQQTKTSIHARSVVSNLNITQTLRLGGPIYAAASNSLIGEDSQIDTDNIFDIDINDSEALDDYLNNLGLHQTVSVQKAIYNISAINYLSLTHQAAPAQFLSASNHIHLSHTTRTVLYEEVVSQLKFNHNVLGSNVLWAEQELDFVHTVNVELVKNQTASNTLEFLSSVSYLVIDFCTYSPGIGAGSFDYTPPPVVSPTLVRRTTTVLTWPYTSPILTLELRNPNFDNTEQFEFRRINRRTKGGELDLFRDEDWPKVERVLMSFTWLSDTQRADLFYFLQKSLGQEIGLLDFESRQWKGFILTPTSAISEPKQHGHSVSLEFEGELV